MREDAGEDSDQFLKSLALRDFPQGFLHPGTRLRIRRSPVQIRNILLHGRMGRKNFTRWNVFFISYYRVGSVPNLRWDIHSLFFVGRE